MSILIRWLLSALALMLVAYIIPGIELSNFYIALITAVIIGLLNLFIRPILVLITLPINIITLGLFTFILNALLFWFAASFIDGFSVSGFWAAFFGALVFSVISSILSNLAKKSGAG
jgi:putative membrane protein